MSCNNGAGSPAYSGGRERERERERERDVVLKGKRGKRRLGWYRGRGYRVKGGQFRLN